MTFAEQLRQEGQQDGWQKGRQETAQKVALRLLQRDMPDEEVMMLTDLPREAVRKLRAQIMEIIN